uniref:Arf-GAP with dual PH domain-containing protein 1-like n=1 Tax=Sinocyclocheilus rhinocerous TaxID=307959 RepID=A0A673FF17_9TELE
MTENERAARTLKHVLQKPGNGSCADCGADNPECGSCSLGVFICLSCSGVHRSIPDLGKVKLLRLSHWEDSEVQFMSERGNDAMNAVYEAALPVYYYKPTHRDCQVLKEQWIRVKYERQEFMENGKKLIYEDESRDGMLMKRGRDNGQFLNRRFILSLRDGTLKYYTKLDAKEPKAVIKVDTINACFQPDKIGNPNGLQITYLRDNITRNIFIYHDSSRERAFIMQCDISKLNRITENNVGLQTEGFKKRWFTLDHRRLMYFRDPLDAFAKGEVFLGHRDHGYHVTIGLPAGTHYNGTWQYGITIETPDRSFLFTCETDMEQKDWMSHFNAVMNTRMSPQEYTVEAYFKHKH